MEKSGQVYHEGPDEVRQKAVVESVNLNRNVDAK